MATVTEKAPKIEFSPELVRATYSTVGYLESDDHGFKITFEDAWDAGRLSMQGFEKEDEELDALIKLHTYEKVRAAWKKRPR